MRTAVTTMAVLLALAVTLIIVLSISTQESSKLESIETHYNLSSSSYLVLEATYDDLVKAYVEGYPVVKSAVWLSEGKKLGVKSSLVPVHILGTTYGHYIEVTVTNLGNKPIGIIYVMLFPYTDSELYEGWSAAIYMYKIDGLRANESSSYMFTSLPLNMTSYKLIVVV